MHKQKQKTSSTQKSKTRYMINGGQGSRVNNPLRKPLYASHHLLHSLKYTTGVYAGSNSIIANETCVRLGVFIS
jgi:hypothetical protein